jgi:hypothetical protein
MLATSTLVFIKFSKRDDLRSVEGRMCLGMIGCKFKGTDDSRRNVGRPHGSETGICNFTSMLHTVVTNEAVVVPHAEAELTSRPYCSKIAVTLALIAPSS